MEPRHRAGWAGGVSALLRNYRGLLLGVPLVTAVVIAGIVVLREPLYVSTVTLSANRADLADTGTAYRETVAVELQTAGRLILSDRFLDRLMERSGPEGVGGRLEPRSLRSHLELQQIAGTRLLQLRYRDTDPQRPSRVVTHIAEEFIRFREEQSVQRLHAATRSVLQRIDQLSGALLPEQTAWRDGTMPWLPVADRGAGLPVLEQIEQSLMGHILTDYEHALTGDVRLAVEDPATPVRDVRQRPVVMTSAAAGLASFGILLLGLWSRRAWWQRHRFPDRVARESGFPLACILPRLHGESARATRLPDDDGYIDSLYSLCARLSEGAVSSSEGPGELAVAAGLRRGRVILLTAPDAAPGSSIVAGHVAAGLVARGKVLLIDARFRATEAGAAGDRRAGLSHVVAGAAPLHRCIHSTAGAFDFMPAGISPPDSRALLANPRLPRVLNVLRRRYENIVIAAPSTGDSSGLRLLLPLASDVLYAVRADFTDRDRVREGARLLEGTGARLVATEGDRDLLRRYGYPVMTAPRAATV